MMLAEVSGIGWAALHAAGDQLGVSEFAKRDGVHRGARMVGKTLAHAKAPATLRSRGLDCP
jgi:hypothetical protein